MTLREKEIQNKTNSVPLQGLGIRGKEYTIQLTLQN